MVAVTTYIGGWAVAGQLRSGYDPREQAISELFELGAPWASRGPLVAGLLLSGIAFLVLAPALHRTLPGHGLTGPVLVAVAGVGTLGVLVAPCTPGCPGAASSTLDLWHSVTAGAGYTALAVAPMAFAWRLRGVEPGLSRWSALLAAAALGLFAVHTLGAGPLPPGLQQRAFNTVADGWYVLIVVWVLVHDARQRRHGAVTTSRAG